MIKEIFVKNNKSIRKERRENKRLKEKEIDKTCNEMKLLLEEYYNADNNISSIKDLEVIEDTLKSSIDWYINNKRRNKAIENIYVLAQLLDFEKEKYYNPNFTKELAMSKRRTAIVNFREPYLLKQHMLNKLVIRYLLLEGYRKGARELYLEELEKLGIKLNAKELKKSLKDGMKKGCYYIEKDGNFEEVTITGNEKILKYIKKKKDKKKKKKDNTDNRIYTKKEIEKVIQRINEIDISKRFQKNTLLYGLTVLISYLKVNQDEKVYEYLKGILKEIDKVEPIDLINEKIKGEKKYNILLLAIMREFYRNGLNSLNGEIVVKNENKYAYYTYLLNRRIKEDKTTDKRLDKIKEEYNRNAEDIELKYFLELKSRKQLEYEGLREKLSKTENYSKTIQDLIREAESDGVRLLVLAEDIKNGVCRQFVGKPTNIERFTNIFRRIYKQIDLNQITNPKLIELIADIKNNGIKDNFGNVVLEPDKNIAINLYKKINCCEGTNKNQRKEEPQEKSIYVCSDLHGQYDVYKTMLGQLKEGDKLYILGDVIDRGPGGIKILQDIIQHKEQIEFFVGNHELMMIQSLFLKEEKERQNWIRDVNGGKETEEDFNKLSPKEQEDIGKLLMNALVYKEININGENIYLVHAKASPAKGKNQETVYEFLQQGREDELKECVWSRINTPKSNKTNEVWKESDISKENTLTIVGHTPTDNKKIQVYDSFVDIDCGAAYYGNGCLLRLNDGKVVYFDNVTKCLEQEKIER